MAIVQISQIQNRRGLQQDLPQLASAELGWSIDSRRLYIGNGTLSEGAPIEGITEVLTEFSILNFTLGFGSNVVALQSNVAILQGNVVTIESQIAALQTGATTSNVATLSASSFGSVSAFTANNAIINYTLTQGTNQRTGTIRSAYSGTTSTVRYEEDYSESATTDLTFNLTANSTHTSLNYTTVTATSLEYQIKSL